MLNYGSEELQLTDQGPYTLFSLLPITKAKHRKQKLLNILFAIFIMCIIDHGWYLLDQYKSPSITEKIFNVEQNHLI